MIDPNLVRKFHHSIVFVLIGEESTGASEHDSDHEEGESDPGAEASTRVTLLVIVGVGVSSTFPSTATTTHDQT